MTAKSTKLKRNTQALDSESAEVMERRKLEHIRIVLEENVQPLPNPLDMVKLPWRALPEIDYNEINTEVDFLDYKLAFPFIIGSMTGGPAKAATINKNLAIAANEVGVPVGLGSSRVVLRDPSAVKSFQVKKFCPNVPVFANLGLVQLNYGFGIEQITKMVELLQVDGLFIHVNHLQEVIQPEGDVNFKGLVEKLVAILPQIPVPVVVKEVGAGFDRESAKMLAEIGVKWLDVAGLGGTSWTSVEAYRRQDDLGFLFEEDGLDLVESLLECRDIKDLNLIAGGGVRTGKDIAKTLILGAKLATAATPLLKPALESPQACVQALRKLHQELKVAMFVCGAGNLQELGKLSLR